MKKQLFDRFESNKDVTFKNLADDIADILGARRAIEGNLPGVLSWGLPGFSGISPQVESDRKDVAGYMRDAIHAFEPRLENVEVIPVAGSNDFSFELKGDVLQSDDDSVTLRIITPRRGGGLGAEVAVIGKAGHKTAVFEGAEGELVDDS